MGIIIVLCSNRILFKSLAFRFKFQIFYLDIKQMERLTYFQNELKQQVTQLSAEVQTLKGGCSQPVPQIDLSAYATQASLVDLAGQLSEKDTRHHELVARVDELVAKVNEMSDRLGSAVAELHSLAEVVAKHSAPAQE
jgi:ABC-type transporter Mla subunit MlaD